MTAPWEYELNWSREIINRESKQRVAEKVAQRLRDGDVVGVGSGSTSFLSLQAIVKRANELGYSFTAIPTSIEVALACTALKVTTTSLQASRPNWSFDGADEVDPAGNMIKGRGGALFKEKILMAASPDIFIVVDDSKIVESLGKNFPVPVEVIPDALGLVQGLLRQLPGVTEVVLRLAKAKDGPVITEYGNLLVDVRIDHFTDDLDKLMKLIPGVVETGLFVNYKTNLLVAGSK